MSAPTYERLAEQLSRGLDLCVRARRLDAQDRTNVMAEAFPGIDLERAAPRLNAHRPETPYLTRSATVAVWVQEQYDRDLAAWDAETRAMLMMLQAHGAPVEGSDDA